VKFSIVHPTARLHEDFQHPWWKACASAAANCDNPSDVEYILVVHQSRRDMLNGLAQFSKFGRFTVVTNYGRDCLVDQSNAGIAATSGEIIIGNEDDMRYPPHWDSKIRELIPDTTRAVCVRAGNDGRLGGMIGLPAIATRVLHDKVGPVDPAYESMYIDFEWDARVRECGEIVDAPHIYFEHFHWASKSEETRGRDAVDAIENRDEAYRVGKEVFERRKAAGFPRVNLPWVGQSLPSVTRPTRAISICIPGETHRSEWEVAFFRVWAALVGDGWDVRVHPGWNTYVHHARHKINQAVIAAAEGNPPDYVLWIDDDNTPSVATVRRLISLMDNSPEIDGATGWYYFQSVRSVNGEDSLVPLVCCGDFANRENPLDSDVLLKCASLAELFADNASPKRIDWAGFGCVLMRYHVTIAIGNYPWNPIDAPRTESGQTGDDSSFFIRANRLGLKFVVDPHCFVDHWKVSPLSPDFDVSPDASPEAKSAIEGDRKRRKGLRILIPASVKKLLGVGV